MNWEKIAELKVIYVQPPTGSNSVIASRKADPYDYVVSVNERRRHLSTAQRSEVAERTPPGFCADTVPPADIAISSTLAAARRLSITSPFPVGARFICRARRLPCASR